jgi:hypothetical protein
VRGKTYKTVDERSRRIEEVKAENDARIVPPFSGALVAIGAQSPYRGGGENYTGNIFFK